MACEQCLEMFLLILKKIVFCPYKARWGFEDDEEFHFPARLGGAALVASSRVALAGSCGGCAQIKFQTKMVHPRTLDTVVVKKQYEQLVGGTIPTSNHRPTEPSTHPAIVSSGV